MKRFAFKMKLTSGNINEYQKRHDEIWPELVKALHDAGIRDYSIFYDEETNLLFAYQNLTDDNTADSLPMENIVREWWDYMNEGIMDYNDKEEPVTISLTEVFHMV